MIIKDVRQIRISNSNFKPHKHCVYNVYRARKSNYKNKKRPCKCAFPSRSNAPCEVTLTWC